ncbi:MAG: porin, partial [Chromatiales bacterium]
SDDLHSVSAGASFTYDDDLTFGASFTSNGDTGLAPDGRFSSAAYGYAFSVNYNNGPWTLGAFYQSAQSEGDPFTAGEDELSAVQFGASYRLNTKVRLYGAVYLYDFENEGGTSDRDQFDGQVFLLGVRVTL